jgi:hypothetical protein
MTVTGIHFADTMVDIHRGGLPAALAAPQRKPLPVIPKASIVGYQHEHQQQSSEPYSSRAPPPQSGQVNDSRRASSSASSHSRSRTTSSQIFPASVGSPDSPSHSNTRRFSTQTTSTTGYPSSQQTQIMSPAQYHQPIYRSGTNNSTNSTAPRRSTSSRSSTMLAPTSYVALMRKQKATVWCDRSQTLDPRTTAAQKAAKHRAALEVHGAGAGRSSTITSSGGKVRSTKAGPYVPANLSGVSVPVRLSANEMLGDEEEAQDGRSLGDSSNANTRIHNRSGSGRSSVHSGTYPSGYPRPNQTAGGRFSTSSTPPISNEDGSPERHLADQSERDFSADPIRTRPTIGSFDRTPSSGEEDQFGEAGELKGPSRKSAVVLAAEQARRAEELRRRGSVDERTMTLGGKGRLFVANPDLDD